MSTSKRARHLTAAVLFFSTLIAPAALADNQKKEPAGSADKATVELMRKQAEISRLADRIEGTEPETNGTGLSGFLVEAKHNRLKVYWKGEVPKAVLREIEHERAKGMTVDVIPAPYTLAELRAEVKRLADVNMTNAAKSGPRLASIAPKHDGTGIDLGVAGIGDVTASAALAAIPGIASRIATEVVPDDGAADASRWADTRPFYGGSYIERWTDGQPQGSCTSAFAAEAGGLTFLVTAAHCGVGEFRTGGGTTIGSTAAAIDRGHDTQLIVAQTAPLIYDGGSLLGERPQFTKTVSGAATSRKGEYVCISGSYSGANCPILVERTGVTITTESGTKTDMVAASRESTPRKPAAGNGDSGSPVFSLDGEFKVVIRGVYSARPTDPLLLDPCEGVPGEGQPDGVPGRRCSSRIYYADVTFPMRTLGFNVRTG